MAKKLARLLKLHSHATKKKLFQSQRRIFQIIYDSTEELKQQIKNGKQDYLSEEEMKQLCKSIEESIDLHWEIGEMCQSFFKDRRSSTYENNGKIPLLNSQTISICNG